MSKSGLYVISKKHKSLLIMIDVKGITFFIFVKIGRFKYSLSLQDSGNPLCRSNTHKIVFTNHNSAYLRAFKSLSAYLLPRRLISASLLNFLCRFLASKLYSDWQLWITVWLRLRVGIRVPSDWDLPPSRHHSCHASVRAGSPLSTGSPMDPAPVCPLLYHHDDLRWRSWQKGI